MQQKVPCPQDIQFTLSKNKITLGDGVFRTDNCHAKNIIPTPMTK